MIRRTLAWQSRSFLILLLLSSTLSCGYRSDIDDEPSPNVIVFLLDDAGFSDFGAFGSEINTPNIDELAEHGLRFKHFYSNARCSPTRASLLTGMYPASVGFAAGTLAEWASDLPLPPYRARLSLSSPTIAELLQKQGYATYMLGKWHLGGSTADRSPTRSALWNEMHSGWPDPDAELKKEFMALPTNRGFDHFFGTLQGEVSNFIAPGTVYKFMDGTEEVKLEATGSYDITSLGTADAAPPQVFKRGRAIDAFYSIDALTSKALDILRDLSVEDAGRSPFFLYMAYQAPHAPLEAREALVAKYRAVYSGGLETLRSARVQHVNDSMDWQLDASTLNSRALSVISKSDVERLAVHAAMVETVDQSVGEIVDSLRTNDQYDNTLIFLVSDNGAATSVNALANTPFRGGKGLLWEGGIRTAALAHWPAKIAPGYTNSIGWIGDLVPTILEAIAKKDDSSESSADEHYFDGRSLLPVLMGNEIAPPDYLFFNDRGQQAVVMDGRWKLLVNPGWYFKQQHNNGDSKLELYDLKSDPAETNNIYLKNKKLAARILEQAMTWQKQQGIIDYGSVVDQRARQSG